MNTDRARPVEIVPVDRPHRREAARVLAEALADNPTQYVMHGPDRAQRIRQLENLALSVLTSRREPALAAVRDGQIIGVVSAAGPGECRPSFWQQIRTIPLIVRLGLSAAVKVAEHGTEWSRYDPASPHCHIGPVGVSPPHQGQGVGTALMQALTRRLDEIGATAYLEADKEENVHFYEKFGFEVIREAILAGSHHWFMRREPHPHGKNRTVIR